MDRKVLAIWAVIGLIWTFAGTSLSAHEGRIVLKNNSAACEGISTWRDGRYRLTGRCAGLVYPYQERIDKYVLWVRDGSGPVRRVGTIKLGHFDGQTNDVFTQVLISVEADSAPRQPGELVIATANLQPLDFGTIETQPAEPLAPIGLPTPTPAPVVIASNGVIRRAGIAIAVVIGVFIAVMIGIFLSRRGR